MNKLSDYEITKAIALKLGLEVSPEEHQRPFMSTVMTQQENNIKGYVNPDRPINYTVYSFLHSYRDKMKILEKLMETGSVKIYSNINSEFVTVNYNSHEEEDKNLFRAVGLLFLKHY